MLDTERTDIILSILKKKKVISNRELLEKLNCSLSTLRRDLLVLEKNNLVQRTHGGVILNTGVKSEPANFFRENEQLVEKKAIAQLAIDFIGPGMCLFLDASSTVLQLVDHLAKIENLIILTNGVTLANRLNNQANVSTDIYLLGGKIKKNSASVIGTDFSEEMVNKFRIDLSICSCRGIDPEGVYEANMDQALLKQLLIKKSQGVLLLVDDSKFGKNYFYTIGNFKDYQAVITNKKPTEDYLLAANSQDSEFLY